MKRIVAMALLGGVVAVAPAFGAEEKSACAREPHSEGLRARMKVIREQSDRIEWTIDRAEQRQLMQLHIKHLREGMQELRHRRVAPDCRIEMMSSMMEAMIRHDLVVQEAH